MVIHARGRARVESVRLQLVGPSTGSAGGEVVWGRVWRAEGDGEWDGAVWRRGQMQEPPIIGRVRYRGFELLAKVGIRLVRYAPCDASGSHFLRPWPCGSWLRCPLAGDYSCGQ